MKDAAAPLDLRLTLARPDLADRALEGQVEATRFEDPKPWHVSAPKARLFRRPDMAKGLDTELLHGEQFDVLDRLSGWAWGRSALDGYVGFVAEADLTEGASSPTHTVATRMAHIYASAELKIPPVGALPFGALVTVAETRDSHARVGPERWIPLPQLQCVKQLARDWVAAAEKFLGTPYVWGGRSSWGVDCSGLVQLARQAAGHACPRDSDMQEDALGRTLEPNEPAQRGDLIFWRGHVGIVAGPNALLHANAHHMAVATEPLDVALERIGQAEFGQVTRRARLDG